MSALPGVAADPAFARAGADFAAPQLAKHTTFAATLVVADIDAAFMDLDTKALLLGTVAGGMLLGVAAVPADGAGRAHTLAEGDRMALVEKALEGTCGAVYPVSDSPLFAAAGKGYTVQRLTEAAASEVTRTIARLDMGVVAKRAALVQVAGGFVRGAAAIEGGGSNRR